MRRARRSAVISSHPITGAVVNNLGQPIYDAQFTSGEACAALPSDTQGRAWAYFTAPGVYTLTVAHPRFGSLPALRERSVGGPRPRVVLPPQDNVLLNSHFETNAGWTFFGQAGYAGIAHSGWAGAAITGSGVISQRVVIPPQGVLSLLARTENSSPGDQASVRVQVDMTVPPLRSEGALTSANWPALELIEPAYRLVSAQDSAQDSAQHSAQDDDFEDWRHVWMDLRAGAGLPVAVVIETVDVDPPGLRLAVDEVTLGAPATGTRFLYLPVAIR
jgi:hypothetical protein